ncbi:NOG1 family protein [Methanobrevibacter filiformis]|uniref:GTPase ObgE/CgtA n=1 Tax=Methanobrevibacter filiformis TaxID=55758 RepID=A0A166F5H6_9EURY|nr:NOG1 family protein [Methanobrevibacter filiformis]KZX17335.1 GTPase ObgE/CgtA [Methanobrevibacter filiformis]
MMIPTIPTPEELLDKGFRRGKKTADLVRTSKIPRSIKGKKIEEAKVITACQVIKDRLKMIVDRVPTIEELPEFYQDYIDITVGVDQMKQSLGAMNWAYGILTQLEKDYAGKIRRAPSSKASELQRQAYGRVASVVKKIKKDLDFLDFAKANLRNMPTIDFEATTIVIAGFPNVGKSTLLRQITDAEPEVANYPFTTKGIQIGHIERKWKHIQFIDTPGLLDRPVLDMNDIELNAMVALEHLADAILFIFDPSQTSGYLLENQYTLYNEIEKVFNITPIALFNKIDIVNTFDEGRQEEIKEFISQFDDPLLISANQGKGIEEIINKLENVRKQPRDDVHKDPDDYNGLE